MDLISPKPDLLVVFNDAICKVRREFLAYMSKRLIQIIPTQFQLLISAVIYMYIKHYNIKPKWSHENIWIHVHPWISVDSIYQI